jgi:hypothetical protein
VPAGSLHRAAEQIAGIFEFAGVGNLGEAGVNLLMVPVKTRAATFEFRRLLRHEQDKIILHRGMACEPLLHPPGQPFEAVQFGNLSQSQFDPIKTGAEILVLGY